jgi:hypothetical protein
MWLSRVRKGRSYGNITAQNIPGNLRLNIDYWARIKLPFEEFIRTLVPVIRAASNPDPGH